jgi:hypothetical protein
MADMTKVEELQKAHEGRLSGLLDSLRGQGADSDLALVRALVHRAVHVAAESKSVQFCALGTYLAEMIGHAHQLQHSGGEAAPVHGDVVH